MSELITQLPSDYDNDPQQYPCSKLFDNTSHSIPNKENFLNYLIQDNTHYADFDKIEAHYLDVVYKKLNQHNTNKLLLSEKQQEYTQLLQEIQTEINDNLCIDNPSFLDEYDVLIATTKREIQLKDHELQCYTKMYTRLYKANYLVRKRFDDEGKFVPINEKQYEKYVLIKNHAMIAMNNQTNALNDLKSFIEITSMKYGKEITERTKVFNELEFQILMIKKDSLNVETLLKGIQKRKIEIKKELWLIGSDNNRVYDTLCVTQCDYIKCYKQLIDVYFQLEVKDIESTIGKFNLFNKEHYELSSRFDNSNKEIVKLNNELTTLINELEKTLKAIELKRNEELKEKGKGSKEGLSSETLQTKIKESHYHFIKLQSAYKNKENYLKIIFVFMLNYMQLIADSLSKSAFPNYFSLCKSIKGYQKYLTITKDSIHLSFAAFVINKQFLKLAFSIYNEFMTHLFTLISSAFNLVCIELYFNSLSSQQKHKVYTLFSGVVFKAFEEQIANAIIRQENKMHIYGRSHNEIFEGKAMQQHKNEGKAISKERKLEITDNVLYRNYMNFLLKGNDRSASLFQQDTGSKTRKKSIIQPVSLIASLKNNSYELEYMKLFPNRSLSIMNKYTNDLVIKHNRQLKQGIHTPMASTMKNQQIKLFRRKEAKYAYDIAQQDKESSFIAIEEPCFRSKKEKLPIKLSRTSMMRNNKSISTNTKSLNHLKSFYESNDNSSNNSYRNEINKIYTRLNDIRKLEYFYFKTHDKSLIENHVFNEIYYKYKRRNLNKYSKLSKSHGSLLQSKPSMIGVVFKDTNDNVLKAKLPPVSPSSNKGILKHRSSFRGNQSKPMGKSQSTKSVTAYSFSPVV